MNIELEMPGNNTYIYATHHHDSCYRTDYEFLIRFPAITLDRIIDKRRVSRRHRNWTSTVLFSRRARSGPESQYRYVPRKLLEEVRQFLQERIDFDAEVKVGE